MFSSTGVFSSHPLYTAITGITGYIERGADYKDWGHEWCAGYEKRGHGSAGWDVERKGNASRWNAESECFLWGWDAIAQVRDGWNQGISASTRATEWIQITIHEGCIHIDWPAHQGLVWRNHCLEREVRRLTSMLTSPNRLLFVVSLLPIWIKSIASYIMSNLFT